MLTILLGIGAFIFACCIKFRSKELKELFVALGVIVLFFCIVIGITFESGKYEKPILYKTISLASINETNSNYKSDSTNIYEAEKKYYLIYNLGGSYQYYYEAPYKLGDSQDSSYEVESVFNHIIIFENDEITEPYMEIYQIKSIPTLWTFSQNHSYEMYQFYIPKDSILIK